MISHYYRGEPRARHARSLITRALSVLLSYFVRARAKAVMHEFAHMSRRVAAITRGLTAL